jgi:hypothetical protein
MEFYDPHMYYQMPQYYKPVIMRSQLPIYIMPGPAEYPTTKSISVLDNNMDTFSEYPIQHNHYWSTQPHQVTSYKSHMAELAKQPKGDAKAVLLKKQRRAKRMRDKRGMLDEEQVIYRRYYQENDDHAQF